MKLSEQWLRKWVNPTIDTNHLTDQLTMAGLEVGSVTPAAGDFTGVVIGELISVVQHPDAVRLYCCQVNVGDKSALDIVCGGVNLRPGLRVAVAKVGAVLPGEFKIKKAKLRGAPSHGMICSSGELGLGKAPKGEILALREDAPIGKDFREYLGLDDCIIDIDLTPNRGDCACVRGIARELAIANRMAIKAHDIKPQVARTQETFPIVIDAPEACPRYVGRVIRHIRLDAVTPLWMEERLRRSGLRVIHPVVDVLNYVMLEIGQPMHAFDLDQLNETLTVRYSGKNEHITLLDEQDLKLREGSLIIADTKGPLALAGVMGGLHSSVIESTRHIFLESALFEPISIRQSAKDYLLQTDSSYRFERGVDYALQVDAMERATELLLNIVGGEASSIIEHLSETHLPKQKTITFRSQEVQRLLGMIIEESEVERILMALGMDLRAASGGWVVGVPSYRYDLGCEADLVEEIARIYGYDKIPATPVRCEGVMPVESETHRSRSRIAGYLIDQGYSEAITYSFISKEMQSLFDPEANVPTIINPIASDMALMRSSLWPGLIQAVQYNQHHQNLRVRLFEMGLSFHLDNDECAQVPKLAMVVAGNAYPEQWSAEKRAVDFYDLKGDIEGLLMQTGCQSVFSWAPGKHPALHPGQTAVLSRGDEPVGCLGVLHPNLVDHFELQQGVCCFEVSLSAIQQGKLPQYKPISKFPVVRRDLAIIIDRAVSVAEIQATILKKVGRLLNNIKVFDIYEGKNIEKGKKSVALGLTFQDPSRTLIDTEINDVIQDVVANLERDFNAKLRA